MTDGEDLLVRIFDNGQTTPLLFFIQVKATKAIEPAVYQCGAIEIRVSRAHALAWNRLIEPVILVIWDSQANIAYWQSVQAFLDTPLGVHRLGTPTKTIRIQIPTSNRWDQDALFSIRSLAASRLAETYGYRGRVAALYSFLEKRGFEIDDDDPEGDVIIVKNPEGDYTFLTWGTNGAWLNEESKRMGLTPEGFLKWMAHTFHP